MASETSGRASVVTMAFLSEYLGKSFTFGEDDGKCTARTLSGKRELLKAHTPGDLLRLICGHYGMTGGNCST